MRSSILVAAALLTMACQQESVAPEQVKAKVVSTKATPVLPFIENDYARALAEAKQRNVPLFVEAWAPW